VGTRLLLLPLLLLLLLFEAIESLPTKNFVELRLNDVETTAGERGLIPGKAWTQTRWRKLLQVETRKSRENERRTCFEKSERFIVKRQ